MAVKAVVRAVIKERAKGGWSWRATLKGKPYAFNQHGLTLKDAKANARHFLPPSAQIRVEPAGVTFSKRYNARLRRIRKEKGAFPWENL